MKLERLHFRLTPFVRFSWVSPKAQEVWGPRISSITSMMVRLINDVHAPEIPQCCKIGHKKVVEEDLIDPTWIQYDIQNEMTIVKDAPWQTNAFFRPLGLYPDFNPCSIHCEETINFMEKIQERAKVLGMEEPFQWFKEILSWPISWNAYHGIAEVQVPILRMIYNTDSFKGKFILHREGTEFPQEGARGLKFPFKQPKSMRGATCQ